MPTPHAHPEFDTRTPYTVTYTFADHRDHTPTEVIQRIQETITRLRADGLSVDFLGATATITDTGHATTIRARYLAPTKGSLAQLNTHARLPASGNPQPTNTTHTPPHDQEIPAPH